MSCGKTFPTQTGNCRAGLPNPTSGLLPADDRQPGVTRAGAAFNRGGELFQQLSFGSVHPGGCQCRLMDGSVQCFADTTDALIWKASGTVSGSD
ncbi:MAG: DUF1559 domain-containing protein [Planctomycetaceae bacterium]|nr:DUF1559 domain-containing protein [Planctomycetaceae bacterium]